MTEPSIWMRKIQADPDHSHWYVERFRRMAAAGEDLAGEARTVHALAPREGRVLDAGCGSGRIGGAVAQLGHEVVGVDVDPVLVAAAEEDYPGPRWLVGDLAELDLPAAGITEAFDVIVSGGNVMTFLAPSTRIEVLRRLRLHLRPRGRVIVGFGAGRGYDFAEFLEEVAKAGLQPELLLSTWDLQPFRDDSDFLVAILGSATGAAARP